VVAAALFASRQPAAQSDVARGDVLLEPDAPLENEMRPVRVETKRTLVQDAPAVPAARPSTADGAMRKPPARESVDARVAESTAKPPAVESTAKDAVADSSTNVEAPNAAMSAAKADSQSAAAVTITGCVEQDDNSFWLKDTSGTEVPQTRSWRSGFLKKRPSRIELVDAGHSLKLRGYVGERVAATGTFVNREMQARSLRRVATSCN
jgi:hypothetical protein